MIKSINLVEHEFINLINLGLGLYKPLKGFNTKKEFENILLYKKIDKTKNWTVPILLNAKKKKFNHINTKCFLIYKNKKIGFIKVQSIFEINKNKYCKKIFNTNSQYHPTVKKIYKSLNRYVGGEIKIFKNFLKNDKKFAYNVFKLNKSIFSNSTVFTTRNICHLGHQLIHKKIIKSKKKLLICIIQSEKNKFDPDFVIRSYQQLRLKYRLYKDIQISKIYLPSLMAGPNEAYLQAIYLNNLNCKSFIIGRDHAGYKNNFKKYESQKIFDKLKKLKIKITKTKEPVMCNICKTVFFSNIGKCKCNLKIKKSLLSIDGRNIKEHLLNNNISKASIFLNTVITKFCTKNIKQIKNFKG
tara:strand:- start:2603 stop:3670 length:1068 start_codon:yes stop_codon:yes gene_type:complete